MSRTKDAVISLQNYERSKGRILSQKESDAFWSGYGDGINIGREENKKKLIITFAGDAVETLEEMKKFAGFTTIGEVIESSVTVNRFFQQEMAEGKEIILRDKKNGVERTVVLLR